MDMCFVVMFYVKYVTVCLLKIAVLDLIKVKNKGDFLSALAHCGMPRQHTVAPLPWHVSNHRE